MQVILTFPIFILMLMNLTMNVGNAKMIYIVKQREY